MLVSLKYEFALLLIPKCGSTALESALSRHCDIKIGGQPRLKHMSFGAYQRHVVPLIGELCGRSFDGPVFGLFREPLDWLFSWYRFRSREALMPSGDVFHNAYTGGISFSRFLDEHFRPRPAAFAKVGRQSDFIEAAEGMPGSVTLFRYEDIQQLVHELERRTGKLLTLAEKNTSPRRELNLSEVEMAQAKSSLAFEYSIYDGIAVPTARIADAL